MLKKILKQSFIISNKKFDIDYEGMTYIKYGEFYIISFDERIKKIATIDILQLDFNSMEWNNGTQPINYGVILSKNKICIINNEMNTREIYYIYEPNKNLFILFNNLIMAKQILQTYDLPIEYNSDKIFENGSYFKYIKLVEFAEKFDVEIIKKRIQVIGKKGRDIVRENKEYDNYSMEEAGEYFYNKLYDATKTLTQNYQDVSISLSGGLDSGTIAYILTQLNKNISAYSVGTEWGDEYVWAGETALFLNTKLIKFHFTKEEIIKQIPNVIAFFAFAQPNNIEISLVAQCLYNKVETDTTQKRIMFVTGFGSDIINAGLFSPFNHYDELKNEIDATIIKSRSSNKLYSNIFSNNNALYYNINVIHPFWDNNVVSAALNCPVRYKVVDNQDKYFFRKMMEQRLGKNIAWRKKQAAHHGSGIAFNLKRALSGSQTMLTNEEYQRYYKNIHKEIFYNNNLSILNL